MPQPWLSLALAVPAVVLGAGAWLAHVPGEWSRAALLAWSVVVLAYLVGTAVAPQSSAWAAVALGAAFAALALGGAAGLGLAAVLLGVLAALGWTGTLPAPVILCLITAAAAGLGAARSLTAG